MYVYMYIHIIIIKSFKTSEVVHRFNMVKSYSFNPL